MDDEGARLTAGHGVHLVQFYGDDGELAASAGGFLAEGLADGSPAVVVATPAHRAAIGAGLGAGASSGGGAGPAGLVMTDAAGMLDSFLASGRLDPGRFNEAASSLITRVAIPGRPVRIYAEMVALLWDAGQVTLALELEELWNEAALRLPFSLLCGYPARLLADPGGTAALAQVCCLHSGILGPHPHLPGAARISLNGAGAVRGFPWEKDSARQARHFVQRHIGTRFGGQVAVDAAIITAELAANAVLHARTPFTVTITCPPGRIRISVRDTAPLQDGRPLPVTPGHGLHMVAQLAAAWAAEPLPAGKNIWAELAAAP